jgi:hypothetical protein
MKVGWYTGAGRSIWPTWPGQAGDFRLHVVQLSMS